MRKALILAGLLLIPAATLAQTHRFELTPQVGWRFDGEIQASNDFLDDDLDIRVDEGAFFGLIFDVPLNQSWQVEFIANRQNSEFIIDEGLFEPEEVLGDVTVSYYHAGISFQWGPGQVNGFFSGGLGLARIDPDFPEVEAENRFSGNLGGGLKVFVAENVGLRFEGRGYWTDLETDVDRRDRRFDSDEGLWQGEVSAGLIVSW